MLPAPRPFPASQADARAAQLPVATVVAVNVVCRGHRAWVAALGALLAAAVAAGALAPAADAGKAKKIRLMAPLKGKHTVPGPGDPDGSGKLKLVIATKPKKPPRLCWELSVQGLGGVRKATIRKGVKEERGPSVLRLFKVASPVTGEGTTKDCMKVKRKLVRKLKRNPGGHYAEVSNSGYPQGALRGQLRKVGR